MQIKMQKNTCGKKNKQIIIRKLERSTWQDTTIPARATRPPE